MCVRVHFFHVSSGMFFPPLLLALIWNLRGQVEMGIWRRYSTCSPWHTLLSTHSNLTLLHLSFFRFALLAQAVIGKPSHCILWTCVNCAYCRWSFNFLVRSQQVKVCCRCLSEEEEVSQRCWFQRTDGWGMLRGKHANAAQEEWWSCGKLVMLLSILYI